MVTELVVGMRMPTVSSSSLIEHLLPWMMDLKQGTQIVEVCDSTSLQTSNNGIPQSRARKTGGCRDYIVPDIWEGRDRSSITRGCVVPVVLFGWPDT